MPGTPPPLEVSVQEVKRMMDAGEKFLLLDVRQPKEYDTARIAGAQLVPLSELPQRVGELRAHAGGTIITHCHKGMRSLQAAQWLRGQGFSDVRSMAGGIEAWSQQIDPGVPKY
jgi:rhodanese-related sulfurtransferase